MTGEAEKPREPAWISRLSRMNVAAEGMRGRKRQGSSGAASEGKRLLASACSCGWQGTSRELKAGPDGLACPLCGGGGLKPK